MKIAVRRSPSTSQNRNAEPSWSLIRLVGADRDDEEEADRERPARATIVRPQVQPPISSAPPRPRASCALAEIAERLEADLQRLAERDDAADHRQAQDPVALRPGDERLGGDLDLAARALRHGRPPRSRRRASSRPRAPPGRRPARRAWRPGLPSGIVLGGCVGALAAARRRGACARPAGSRLLACGCAWRRGAGSARRGRRCRPASACPCRTGGSRSRSRRAARPWSSACRTRSRTSSARARATYSGWIRSSSPSILATGRSRE